MTAGYTGDNLRAWKQDNLGNRTCFLYDGEDVIAELDATGALTAYQTWGGNGLLSRHTSSGSSFYTFDPVGSVSTVTNSAGAVQGDEAFDATGKRLGSFASSPVSFCGQWGYYEDVEMGLFSCGHRYYDPCAARFINRDPIGYEGGVNLYSYCANSLISDIDPSGFILIPIPGSPGECLDESGLRKCIFDEVKSAAKHCLKLVTHPKAVWDIVLVCMIENLPDLKKTALCIASGIAKECAAPVAAVLAHGIHKCIKDNIKPCCP